LSISSETPYALAGGKLSFLCGKTVAKLL